MDNNFVVCINDALFELLCTKYDNSDAAKLIDILSNTKYVINPDYIDLLYAKKIVLFADIHDQIALVEKLICLGKLDITIVYLYDLSIYKNSEDITSLINKSIINLLTTNSINCTEFVKIIEYINNNEHKNFDLILTIMKNINLSELKINNFNKQLDKLFTFLATNTEKSATILSQIIICYCTILMPTILVMYNNNKLFDIVKNYPDCLKVLYECFDCQYDQIDIVENMNLLNNFDVTDALNKLKNQKKSILNCNYPETFTQDDIIYSLKYIDKQTYSYWLVKKPNRSLLKLFIQLDNYTDVSLVDAMRILLNKLILSKEFQDIVCVLEMFSDHWEICNNINSKNTLTFQLICAILMLNTDLHNPNVVRKISLKKFKLNWYKNIDTNKKVPISIMNDIYQNILTNQFNFS